MGILSFQRRLYRRFIEEYTLRADPFSSTSGSFYDILRMNGLVVEEKRRGEFWKSDVRGGRQAEGWLQCGLSVLKCVLGAKYYPMVMRWLARNCRAEEQLFLLRKGLPERKSKEVRQFG